MEAFYRSFKRKFGAVDEVQARMAALSRTNVEPVDAEAEWQKLADDEDSFQHWQEVAQKSAEGLADRTAEGLDRYFSHQVRRSA
jgi:tRNA U55 pseudouridine synthase TruB